MHENRSRYSVPHPYEPKMNIRLQTVNAPALTVLRSGLRDLENTAEAIDAEFVRALNSFNYQK